MFIIKKILDIFTWGAIVLIVVMGIFTLSSNSSVLSGYRSYLVQSGSMEPTIHIADIVVVKPQSTYYKNDIITFKGNDNRVVTHRIVGIDSKTGKNLFTTKGDANRDTDGDLTGQDKIIGKVSFVVPKLGFLVAFSRTTLGFAILVAIPFLGLAIDQIAILLRRDA